MATKLEVLHDENDPSRTIDKGEKSIRNALSSYHREQDTVGSWEEHKACLAEMMQTGRNAVLNLADDFSNDLEQNYHEAIHYLEREYSTIQAVYDIMKTGAEGGIYKILRTLARLMAEDYSQNEIKARVAAYWSRLSVDEKLAAPDEYVEKYQDILPQKTKEETVRLKIAFSKVLEEHPRMLKRLRELT